MEQKSSKQRAEEAVLDLKGKLRQLNKTLAGKGVVVAENAPLVATIKAVEGMTAGGGGGANLSHIIAYKNQQFEYYPEPTVPEIRFRTKSAYYLFWNSSLTSLPKMEGVGALTTLEGVCYSSKALRFADFGELTSATTIFGAFSYCVSLERVTMTTTTALKLAQSAFVGCAALREVKGTLDLSNVESTLAMFDGCVALEEVRIKSLKANIDLSACVKLSLESVRHLINNAQSVSGKRIDLSRKLLEANEEALGDLGDTASDKGWTINYK